MLCYVTLYHVMPCHAILCNSISHYIMILYSIVLQYVMLYHIILYHIMIRCIISYYVTSNLNNFLLKKKTVLSESTDILRVVLTRLV